MCTYYLFYSLSVGVKKWSTVGSVFNTCALSLVFHSNSWVLSLHKKPCSNPQSAPEKKGVTSVYLHTSMFKKQEEPAQRSTEDKKDLRGCRLRKNKSPPEGQRETKPADPPAWSHLTCTFGLKSRVMSQLPCASPRWPAFPALPPSSFYWPNCYCGSSSPGRSWWEPPPPPAPTSAPAPTRPAESSVPGKTWRRCLKAYQSTHDTSTCRRTPYRYVLQEDELRNVMFDTTSQKVPKDCNSVTYYKTYIETAAC